MSQFMSSISNLFIDDIYPKFDFIWVTPILLQRDKIREEKLWQYQKEKYLKHAAENAGRTGKPVFRKLVSALNVIHQDYPIAHVLNADIIKTVRLFP